MSSAAFPSGLPVNSQPTGECTPHDRGADTLRRVARVYRRRAVHCFLDLSSSEVLVSASDEHSDRQYRDRSHRQVRFCSPP